MRRQLLAALAALVFVPGMLAAQVTMAPQLNYGIDDADFGLGGRVEYVWPFDEGAFTIGSFDYFFPSSGDYWEVNINIGHRIPVEVEDLGIYAGAGLNWAHRSFENLAGNRDTDNRLGLNLLAGLKYYLTNVTPFGEIRVEAGGGKQVVFTGGVLFDI
ncbi:MAG: outer membrane beta-barrel protein [Gemmatimonadales bacterium]|nr:outer membrane beta-barrel protein [Gemmatimonadales bacterium]